ncbi:hypothetical protein WDW86_22480 [Bdellovibrionota bacterium FG-2]
MNLKKQKYSRLSFLIPLALLSLSLSPSLFAETSWLPAPPATPPNALKTQLRYMDLLLKIRNVKYVATASCDERTGTLVTFKNIGPGPTVDCIAVRMKHSSDISAVENIYENPLQLEGILILFTDQDPIPNKGGITVHN